MKHVVFHFDFASPDAAQVFERLPHALEGLSYRVDYRPSLAGVALTAGEVQQLARERGAVDPVPATINRYVCEAIFRSASDVDGDSKDSAEAGQIQLQIQPLTMTVDGHVFSDAQAVPMLRNYLVTDQLADVPAPKP